MVTVDADTNSEYVQVIKCDLKSGSVQRSIHIGHCETFKQELIFLSWISLLYILYYSYKITLLDEAIHCECGKVI